MDVWSWLTIAGVAIMALGIVLAWFWQKYRLMVIGVLGGGAMATWPSYFIDWWNTSDNLKIVLIAWILLFLLIVFWKKR